MGLGSFVGDLDTNAMCSIGDRIKTLVVYLDHEDTFVCLNQDDIVVNPVCELQKELPDFYTTILGQQNAVPHPKCGSTSVDDCS